jgi:hypothetical protein
MINEANEGLSLLERPEAIKQLAAHVHPEDMPEVISTRQTGPQAEVDIYKPKKTRRHEDRVEEAGEIES